MLNDGPIYWYFRAEYLWGRICSGFDDDTEHGLIGLSRSGTARPGNFNDDVHQDRQSEYHCSSEKRRLKSMYTAYQCPLLVRSTDSQEEGCGVDIYDVRRAVGRWFYEDTTNRDFRDLIQQDWKTIGYAGGSTMVRGGSGKDEDGGENDGEYIAVIESSIACYLLSLRGNIL